jgi:hypothetical protein
MPGNLRIGRPIVGDGGSDGLRFAQFIDLDHPGDDRAARGLPDEGSGETAGEKQIAEGDESPIIGLRPGRADALVPGLRGFLIGCFGFGRTAPRTPFNTSMCWFAAA